MSAEDKCLFWRRKPPNEVECRLILVKKHAELPTLRSKKTRKTEFGDRKELYSGLILGVPQKDYSFSSNPRTYAPRMDNVCVGALSHPILVDFIFILAWPAIFMPPLLRQHSSIVEYILSIVFAL